MSEHTEAHLDCCGGKGYCEECYENWPCPPSQGKRMADHSELLKEATTHLERLRYLAPYSYDLRLLEMTTEALAEMQELYQGACDAEDALSSINDCLIRENTELQGELAELKVNKNIEADLKDGAADYSWKRMPPKAEEEKTDG